MLTSTGLLDRYSQGGFSSIKTLSKTFKLQSNDLNMPLFVLPTQSNVLQLFVDQSAIYQPVYLGTLFEHNQQFHVCGDNICDCCLLVCPDFSDVSPQQAPLPPIGTQGGRVNLMNVRLIILSLIVQSTQHTSVELLSTGYLL